MPKEKEWGYAKERVPLKLGGPVGQEYASRLPPLGGTTSVGDGRGLVTTTAVAASGVRSGSA